MLRLTVLLMLLIGLIILIVVGYIAYRKLRKGIGSAWDKGVEVASEQQQRWKHREHIKSQPDFIQKAHQQSEQIERDINALPSEWQALLKPLNQAMQDVLLISISDTARVDKVRGFYNTSLPAYASFVATLKSDHMHLSAQEKQKAIDNLAVFQADFKGYEEKVQQARRFDFDVLMDVIKVRLKNR